MTTLMTLNGKGANGYHWLLALMASAGLVNLIYTIIINYTNNLYYPAMAFALVLKANRKNFPFWFSLHNLVCRITKNIQSYATWSYQDNNARDRTKPFSIF